MEEQQLNELITTTTDYQLQKLETMKKGLKRYLRKRKKEFAIELNEYIEQNGVDGEFMPDENKIPLYTIIQNVFSPIIKVAGATPSYSADEFALAFDFYKSCADELNKQSMYVPKIEDFCGLLNISRKTFDRYQQTSPDENMREVCNKIQDFCVARIADGAMTGRLEKVYAVFHQKSSNKQRDNDPVQNNTFIQNNNIMSDEQFADLANKIMTEQ